MRFLPLAGLLILVGSATAQIGTPPPCPAGVIDRESFSPYRRAIKFHLRFHVGADTFDARSVVALRRHEPLASSCSDPEVIDRLIAELIQQRNAFWPH
jgi:hypothetical protein